MSLTLRVGTSVCSSTVRLVPWSLPILQLALPFVPLILLRLAAATELHAIRGERWPTSPESLSGRFFDAGSATKLHQ